METFGSQDPHTSKFLMTFCGMGMDMLLVVHFCLWYYLFLNSSGTEYFEPVHIFLNWCKRFQLLQLHWWFWSQGLYYSSSQLVSCWSAHFSHFITKLFLLTGLLTLDVENLSWAKALQKRSGSSKLCLTRGSNKFPSNHSFTTCNLQSLFKICYLYVV